MKEIPLKNSTIAIEDIQDVIDAYILECNQIIPLYLKDHLILSYCSRVQLKHLAKDFFRNPINVLWAIPYFSIRKSLEIAEKTGSLWAKIVLLKIPKALRTDYQKEIERSILKEVFGFSRNKSISSPFESRLNNHPKLQNMTPENLKKIVSLVENDIRAEVSLQCTKRRNSPVLLRQLHLSFLRIRNSESTPSIFLELERRLLPFGRRIMPFQTLLSEEHWEGPITNLLLQFPLQNKS